MVKSNLNLTLGDLDNAWVMAVQYLFCMVGSSCSKRDYVPLNSHFFRCCVKPNIRVRRVLTLAVCSEVGRFSMCLFCACATFANHGASVEGQVLTQNVMAYIEHAQGMGTTEFNVGHPTTVPRSTALVSDDS